MNELFQLSTHRKSAYHKTDVKSYFPTCCFAPECTLAHEYINDKFCLDVFVQVLQFDEITKRYLFVITVSNVQTSQKYIYQM